MSIVKNFKKIKFVWLIKLLVKYPETFQEEEMLSRLKVQTMFPIRII